MQKAYNRDGNKNSKQVYTLNILHNYIPRATIFKQCKNRVYLA